MPKHFTGSNIQKKRNELNLTQEAFAKCVGISAATISRWEESGRRKINLREINKKAQSLLW